MLGFPHTLFAPDFGGETLGEGTIPLGWSGYSFYLIFLCSSLAIVVHLEKTLRVSAGWMRERIKFMIVGVGSLFAVQIYISSQALLLTSIHLSATTIHAIAILSTTILIIISFSYKYLFNVEICLSRPLLYNSVIIISVGIYLLVVGIFSKLISNINIDKILPLGISFVLLSVIILAIILLSASLQHDIKQFINRHFYRLHYDYRMVWTACTQRMTSVVEVQELCVVVARMISDIFAVPSVTLWLADEERQDHLTLGGSTVFWDRRGLPPEWEKTAAALVACMRQHTFPVDLALPATPGLHAAQRDVLKQAQIRYGTGLTTGQQLLGVITLSDRLTQEAFSVEDFDLLKTVADQAAASLLNLQLSQRLLRAKEEMEALQTVSR